MILTIDTKSGIPVYRQIIQWVEYNMSIGKFKPGQKLPTVRQLAVDLKINPNTVAKAYNELEIRGFVNTQVGYGTFISEKKIDISSIEKIQKAEKISAQFLIQMNEIGFNKEDCIRILKNFNFMEE
ncbi:MAG: GntR family transcriptional regulator [Spirochaetes bacterium]|nr:GntR family transcriptional regulator [Spirochaetota bacterium]